MRPNSPYGVECLSKMLSEPGVHGIMNVLCLWFIRVLGKQTKKTYGNMFQQTMHENEI